jgi:hypothetical protein
MSQHIEERIKNVNVKMSQNEKRHVQNETTILLHFIQSLSILFHRMF